MLIDVRDWYEANKDEKWAKLKYKYYKFWAASYYRAVRMFGWTCFHWASRQRNLYDLFKEIIDKENL